MQMTSKVRLEIGLQTRKSYFIYFYEKYPRLIVVVFAWNYFIQLGRIEPISPLLFTTLCQSIQLGYIIIKSFSYDTCMSYSRSVAQLRLWKSHVWLIWDAWTCELVPICIALIHVALNLKVLIIFITFSLLYIVLRMNFFDLSMILRR